MRETDELLERAEKAARDAEAVRWDFVATLDRARELRWHQGRLVAEYTAVAAEGAARTRESARIREAAGLVDQPSGA
jgi:hypothetical protein